MNRILKYCLWLLSFLAIVFIVYFFVGSSKPAKNIAWGVDFSAKQTDFLKLDEKETYLAILDDLKARNIKISVHWDLIEKEQGKYDFSDLDWQVSEAEKRDAKIVLAIGMKTPRWPECHLPQWVRNMNEDSQQEEILNELRTIVLRYKDSPSISAWQVENESLLNFGACPWMDANFLKKEVAFVKSLDPNHPVIVTDSGELSLWLRISNIGEDVVGVTTYKRVWEQQIGRYVSYIYPPVFYARRAELVAMLFHKKVMGSELQAEPWCANSIMNSSLAEQAETMNPQQFEYNVRFAEATGIDTFYFWGAEWWYWMKTVHNDPSIWNEAKKLFEK